MDMELKLHSPVGGESITYSWPVSGSTEGREGGDEVVDTIRWACEEHQELKEIVEHRILQDFDVKSYESIKTVCDRFNKAVDSFRQLKDTPWHHRPKERACMPLVRHIIQQCYNYAVKDPERLNHYEPFSPEVYGETSFDLVEQIIRTIRMEENDYFIDLGSGVGQVVLQVAAASGCKFCYGIEKADWPANYAVDMDKQFKKWMSFFGKKHGQYLLEKGDFLVDDIRERIDSATVIFVNNFAFGPQVDHHLKNMFSCMREGAKIVSSKAFCPLNFRISQRNLSDIGSIMQVQELSPLTGAVSWTGKAFAYYVHTIDRKQLEAYFARNINPNHKADVLDLPRRDRQGRIISKKGHDCRNKENSSHRRGGDHTYQAAKALDFDSASNASTITNAISDDNNSNTAYSTLNTEDDSSIVGPTTRRKWTEWVNRPPTSGSESLNDNESSTNNTDAEKSMPMKQKLKKRKTMKRLKNGVVEKKNDKFKKKLRVRRGPVAQRHQFAQAEKNKGTREDMAANSKAGRKQAKTNKSPPLSLDSLNLLHTHTVLSTTGLGVEDSTKYNDRRMAAVATGPFKASTQKKTVRSLDMMNSAVERYLEKARKQCLAFISFMQSKEYRENVIQQRDIELARHYELNRKKALFEKEVSDLQKSSIGLIKKRMNELGIEANTPSELLGHHEVMRQQHRDLQLQKSELQQEIQCLKSEQLQLVSAPKLLSKQNGVVNNLKKNGVVRPVETQRILQREVLSAYTSNQRLVHQVNQLEQDIQRLELINNQLIAADASVFAGNTTPTMVASSPANVSTQAGKTRSGSTKGVKRRSDGSPVKQNSTPVAVNNEKLPVSSERLKEKLHMKENLEAYSRHVHKLKSEVTALNDTGDIGTLPNTTMPCTSSSRDKGVEGTAMVTSVKQEIKFQPSDLSIKGLLEKTKIVSSNSVKNETVTSVSGSSPGNVPVHSTAPTLSAVKSETNEVINGAKKRKTLNGMSVPHMKMNLWVDDTSKNLLSRESVSHSNVQGSISSSPSSSTSSSALSTAFSSSQEGKPTSPWAEERLSLAHDLISFHETPVPQACTPLMSCVVPTSAVKGCGMTNDLVTSVSNTPENHRLQNNYSPISRPSSQSSTEGIDFSMSMSSSIAISQIAQSLCSQNVNVLGTPSVLQQPLASGSGGGRSLLPLSPVPVAMTVDTGIMSGGCVSSRPLITTPITIRTSQQANNKNKAASAGSIQVLASSHSDTKACSIKPQAATPVVTTFNSEMVLRQEQKQHQQVVIQSTPTRATLRSKEKQSVRVDIPAPFSASSIPTTMVPISTPIPSLGTNSGIDSNPLHPRPEAQRPLQPAVKSQQRMRSRSGSQPRLLQPSTQQASTHIMTLSNGLVPIAQPTQEVARMLGTSGEVPVHMAVVNGVPQPVKVTAMQHPAQSVNGQKDADGTVSPDCKPLGDDTSDFSALLALASSEFDLQRNQKRKADESGMDPPEPGLKTVVMSETVEPVIGSNQTSLEESGLLSSNISSDYCEHISSYEKIVKTRSSHSELKKLGLASSDLISECGKSGCSVSDHEDQHNTGKIHQHKQEKEMAGKNVGCTHPSKSSQHSVVLDKVESLHAKQCFGDKSKTNSFPDQSRAKGDKKLNTDTGSMASTQFHREEDHRKDSGVKQDALAEESKERTLTFEQACKASQKTQYDSEALFVRKMVSSKFSDSTKCRERESRLDKHQQQRHNPSCVGQKYSPSHSPLLSKKFVDLQKPDCQQDTSRTSSKKKPGNREDRRETSCTRRAIYRKEKNGYEKDAGKAEMFQTKSLSCSTKQNPIKSKNPKSSPISYKTGYGQSVLSNSKHMDNHEDDKKTSSGKTVAVVKHEMQDASSLCPKNVHKVFENKKAVYEGKNTSLVPKKHCAETYSSLKHESHSDKYKKSVSNRRYSPSNKEFIPSVSAKNGHEKKDKQGKLYSERQSISPTQNRLSQSPSVSSKLDNARSDTKRKCSPSSRNISPIPEKGSSSCTSSSLKHKYSSGKESKICCTKMKTLQTQSVPLKSESHGNISSATAKDVARPASAFPKDKIHDQPKSGNHFSLIQKKDNKPETVSSNNRYTSPSRKVLGSEKLAGAPDLSKSCDRKSAEIKDSSKDCNTSFCHGIVKNISENSKQESKVTSIQDVTSASDNPSSTQGVSEQGTGEMLREIVDGRPVENRPAFEHQVSLGFSLQERSELREQDSCASPAKPNTSLAVGTKHHDINEPSVNRQSAGEQSSLTATLVSCKTAISHGKIKDLKTKEKQRTCRSCTSSPQPPGTLSVTHANSAPSSRAPSPVPPKSSSHYIISGHESSQSKDFSIQDAATCKTSISSSNRAEKPQQDMFEATAVKPNIDNVHRITSDKDSSLKDDMSFPKVERPVSSPEEVTLSKREAVSPTKTVMVTLKDIAPSLKENRSALVGDTSKAEESSKIRSSTNNLLQRAQSPLRSVWRGPRTPPGSPAHSDTSFRAGRRHSRVSSTSSSSSRSSTSSSVSSSTSRGRSTSSTRSVSNRQKSSRKSRANARRRSLRSYSASSTTSTTSSSSEEEIEASRTKQGDGKNNTVAMKTIPAPPSSVSPLFGPLKEDTTCTEKRARVEASVTSESSPSSSLGSLMSQKRPVFLQEDVDLFESSLSSTPSSSTSPSAGWQRLERDSQIKKPPAFNEKKAPKVSFIARLGQVSGSVSGTTEQRNESGQFSGCTNKGNQPLTNISAKNTVNLPLPDLTKPPPTLYCNLTSYPAPSMVASYPSLPVAATRPGYLPLGSPPPIVTMSPGYISHSPSTPSHSNQSALGINKYSQQNNNNNNIKVSLWGTGLNIPGQKSPSMPKSYSTSNSSSSDCQGMKTSQYYPPPAPTTPVQRQRYPASQTYWHSGYKYHQHAAVSSRSGMEGQPTNPPRSYSSGSSHPHSWHPYSGVPPRSSNAMRRH